jgi:hypothetical protein
MDIEYFENEFNDCETLSDKKKFLENFLSSDIDFSDTDMRELIFECNQKINDIVENEATELDSLINLEIEDGLYRLYTCKKSFDSYKEFSNYYVKVDDPKEFYLSTGIGETNSIIQNMINSIKPIYYIIVDDGIGTLKRKNIFPNDLDFSEYFTKFV